MSERLTSIRVLARGSDGLVERCFLVADKCEDQCPPLFRAGLQQEEDGRHHRHDARLVVERPASVEKAALFDQLVWIALPVLGPRIDNVHVGRKKNRFRILVGARHAHEHADSFAVRKLGDVLSRSACVPKHGFEISDHGRHLTLADRSPEGDDLLEHLPGLHVLRALLRHRRA